MIKFLNQRHTVQRFEKNKIKEAPRYEDLLNLSKNPKKSGWYLMPKWANLWHDDRKGWPEIKFCHIKGREYIYESQNITPPQYKIINQGKKMGSYNYFPPIWDLQKKLWVRVPFFALNCLGHFFFDIIPSFIPAIDAWPEN